MPELDLGNVKGPQGKSAYQSALDAGYSGSEEAFNTAMAKAPDAVLYTPQSLSDAQKEQARGNINAAPGGFGLGGGSKLLTPDDDLNDVWENGSYAWDAAPKNAPIYRGSPLTYCSMSVLNKGGDYMKYQNVYTATGNELRRANNGLGWSDFGWTTPPMDLGVEFRTTERYLGKPVYTQVINCGSMPDIGSSKNVSIAAFNVNVVTFISGWCTYYGSMIDATILGMAMSANTANIVIKNLDREVNSNAVMYALVKYTKTTD